MQCVAQGEKEREGGCVEREPERKGKKTDRTGKIKCGREREKRENEREEKMGKKEMSGENTQGKNTWKYFSG